MRGRAALHAPRRLADDGKNVLVDLVSQSRLERHGPPARSAGGKPVRPTHDDLGEWLPRVAGRPYGDPTLLDTASGLLQPRTTLANGRQRLPFETPVVLLGLGASKAQPFA